MKKLVCLFFFSIFFLLSFCGCKARTSFADDGRVKVAATLFPYYDFVREIGGEQVDCVLLLATGMDSHSFEPTAQDILTFQEADVLIYNGGEAETWVTDLLQTVSANGQIRRAMMDCVSLVQEEAAIGMQGGHTHEEEPTKDYDEHIWTSPVNAMQIVTEICEALCEADPAHVVSYRKRAAAYTEQLEALDLAFRDVVASADRTLLVFGDRFPFRYFTDTYGLSYYAAFPGCGEDTEPSVKTLTFLLEHIEEEAVPVVYHVELSNEAVADLLCESSGAQKRLFHSCHNVTEEEFLAGVTYLSLMWENVDALREGLQ